MKFPVQQQPQKNISLYLREDIEIARSFAKIMYREFGKFLSAIILFGSATQHNPSPKRDLDILIILDDIRIRFTEELIETYRILTEKAIAQVDPQRLHIQSMRLTAFWEYVRAGDPVAINILRSGVALVDMGFFDPLQALLDQGRIRPSDESIWTYFTLAPASLHRADQHLLTAMVDLYWSAVDAAHAALMTLGEIPPSPDHVADLLEKKLYAERHIRFRAAKTMRHLYTIFKKIVHREVKSVSGKDYDYYRKEAQAFVDEMRSFIETKKLSP